MSECVCARVCEDVFGWQRQYDMCDTSHIAKVITSRTKICNPSFRLYVLTNTHISRSSVYGIHDCQQTTPLDRNGTRIINTYPVIIIFI